ncbi:hypothetical protein OE470_06715 [Pseudomonas aeruginosa]|nr:hypothetical protein [Pseudomonas aeruginosa]MCU9088375.1 hypothetical protein [Pseudomonas aeruginosa]
MKFVETTDRNGKVWILNTAYIVAVTARSERGADWSLGAWVQVAGDSQLGDGIILNEREARALLAELK